MIRKTDIRDDSGIINIDFVIAVSIFMLAFFFVFHTLSGAVMPYAAEYNRIYPISSRVTDILVKDPGLWNDGMNSGTNWETEWGINQSAVKRIGFAVDGEQHNVLNKSKIDALMSNHTAVGNLTWWEYPVDGTPDGELKNATRAIGLEGFRFYMQIRPVNDSAYDAGMADINIANTVPTAGDVVQIERLALLPQPGRVDGYQLLLWVWW